MCPNVLVQNLQNYVMFNQAQLTEKLEKYALQVKKALIIYWPL